jgi:hypothetical protein
MMKRRKSLLDVQLIIILGFRLLSALVPVESAGTTMSLSPRGNESLSRDQLIPMRYEAEDAYNTHSVSDSTTEDRVTTFATFQGQGAFVEWLVPIYTSGGYEVAIRYFSDHMDRLAELQVGGKSINYEMSHNNPSSTAPWRIEKHTFELGGSPRQTTFRLIAVGSNGPLVDYIEITKLYHVLGYNSHEPFHGSQWHIQRIDAPTASPVSQDAAGNHNPLTIVIQYEVYKGINLDQIKVQILESNCFSPANAGALTTETVVVSNLQASDPDLRILQVHVDIDPGNLNGSNIWTRSQGANTARGTILFCARVELFSYAFEPPESESFLESIVALHVKLSASFHLVEPIGATQIVDRFVEAGEDAVLRSPISVCPCTDDEYECLPNPVTVYINSDLHLCLRVDDDSSNNNLEVHNVVDLSLRQDDQGGGSLVYHAIADSEPRNSLTRVSILRSEDTIGSIASVRTRLLTAFFGEEATPERFIIVEGRVALAFLDPTRRESRRLRSVRHLGVDRDGEEIVDESFQTIIEIVPDESGAKNGAGKRPAVFCLCEGSLIVFIMLAGLL